MIKNNIIRFLKNIPGKKTKRKIISIFVDDYGSVRTKDKKAYEKLLLLGVPMDKGDFSKHDTLESTEDLSMLFDVLTSVKDKNGHYACFTPFTNVANPDFDKIKKSGYKTYFREPITTTYNKYGSSFNGVFKLWKEGIAHDIFRPEYHGTEHVSVKCLLNALEENHKSTILAFNEECIGVPLMPNESDKLIMSTFYIDKQDDNEFLKSSIVLGLDLFQELFGYRSIFFTPPGNASHSLVLNKTLSENGIKYISSPYIRYYPQGNGRFLKKRYYNGKKMDYDQFAIVRNCIFEPRINSSLFGAERCLKDVKTAFLLNNPAIVSSHRVNFVGGLNEKMRNNGLQQLEYLLKEIVKRWPDVEFMNGKEMAKTVLQDNILRRYHDIVSERKITL